MRQALVVLLLFAVSPARADVENDLGLGARASALGGAVGAVGGDYAASAYNPAALSVPSDRPGVAELGLDFVTAVPALWVDGLAACGEGDVAAPLGDSRCVTPVANTYGITLGGRFDIGRAFGLPGLVLGLAIYSPVEGLVASTIRPDDTPSWLMHTDRTHHITIHAALAYRITEWLSVGLGARVIFDEEVFITGIAEGIERVRDPITGEERVVAGARLGVDTAIYGKASPTLGVLVSPLSTLHFGFAWRGELTSDDWGASRLQGIEGVGDIGFLHRFTHVFRPHELAWSASWQPIPELGISAELTWALWSAAASPNWAALEGRFGDVIIPAVGVRASVHPGVELLGGYRYMHRPYDDLGGPTNLLTSNTHTASLGLGLDLDRLIEDEVPFTLTLAGRLAILEDREEMKNGRRFESDRALLENPGYPGYRYGGLVPSVQLGVEAAW